MSERSRSSELERDPPVLEVDQLAKHFGAREAVRSICFSLRPGEIFGLLGPNGAGKTTTIGMIAGVVEPSSGSVRCVGTLGFVPQSIALYPTLTAEENLHFFGRIHGLSRVACKERGRALLELSGLSSRAHEQVGQFSGGMKRRLSIACGVVHEPDVLLLDEPTVGVDPQSRERIYEALSELTRQGLALLLTTHYMDEAERLCHRLAIMDEGLFVAEGTVDELVRGAELEHTIEIDLAVSPDDELVAKLGSLGAHPVSERGYQVTGEGSTKLLPEILAQIASGGNDVNELRVHRPNLGNVFIHLTGKELRD